MEKKADITIITATKNCGNCLIETILSIKNQNYDNIKYIVIDGNSNDSTVNILNEYKDYIDYWVSEEDNGLYEALNKGWALAADESFILFLGAGDKIIELPIKELNEYKSNVIFGRVKIKNKGEFISRVNIMSRFANTLHHQALLVPKIIHKKPPFDTKYKIYADFDFNQRLIKKGAVFKYSNNFLTYAMPGGISKDYSKESYQIANKNFGLLFGIFSYIFYIYQKVKKSQSF